MWTDTAIRLVSRVYLIQFAGLIVIWSIRPDSIGELMPFLPFDFDPATIRLIFTLTVTLLLLCLLTAWEHRRWLRRFIALGPTRQTETGQNCVWQKLTSIILLILGAILGPLILVFPPDIAGDARSLDSLEEEVRFKLNAAAAPVRRPATMPSPDPPRDSLERTRLPVLHLEIPPLSRHRLTAALPRQLGGGNSAFSIYSNEDFSWPYLPAFFTYADRRYPVDIRYRGWNSDHYLGFKKSWRIKFRKTDPFFGRRQFNLINQRDHSLVNDILWSELLRESGIMVPYQFLAHVRIDGEFIGVQTFLEQPDRFFTERHNRNVAQVFGEESPITTPGGFMNPDLWQQYASHTEANDFAAIIDLYSLVYSKDAPDYGPRMERLLDVDHYLKYLAHGTINCQENPSTHNLRWIRDPGVGRFQIIPWYQAPNRFILEGYHRLWQRQRWHDRPPSVAINDLTDGLLQQPRYRQRYLTHLWRLLRSTHHPDRIRERIDELETLFKPDAWADTHMHYDGDMKRYVSNQEWENTLGRLRAMIKDRTDYLARAVTGGPFRLSTKQISGGLQYDLVVTNYADAYLEQITFDLKELVDIDQVRLVITRPDTGAESAYIPDLSVITHRVSFSPRHTLSARVNRTPIPLGPGIIVADLDRVENPDLDFIGSVSKLAPHYRPEPTTYRLALSSPAAIAGRISSLKTSNKVTGAPLPIVAADGSELFPGTPYTAPSYSPKSAKLVCPARPINPRTPEQTLTSIIPDGIVLRATDPSERLRPIFIDTNLTITTNRIIAENEHLTIAPGTTLRFGRNCSLIVYGQITAIGTAERPIHFTARATTSTWGTVFLNSLTDRTNRFAHCLFEHNANTSVNDLPVTAALAAYTSPVTLSNCTFRSITADDAFNSKYVSPTIFGCSFSNNLDAIDIDMGGGSVTSSLFIDNRDDCIDLSSSWATIAGNRIRSGGDKGISVGEKSRPFIRDNIITDATMAVAVKDLSHAVIENNTLVSNRTAVALYRKKISFGPATAQLTANVIHFNDQPLSFDRGSSVTATNNSCSAQLDGPGNTRTRPNYNGAWQLPAGSPLRTPLLIGAHR